MTKEKVIGLTAVYKKVKEGYVAYVEEIPGANTNRKMAEKEIVGEKVLKYT